MKALKGGFTNYGQDIGILMMPTVFPRLIGDIGNARTLSCPVRFRVVNVNPLNLTEKNADEKLIQPFIRAAQSLEAEGCKAITTSCSFLAASQRRLADAVHIPVFTSTLLLVPMLKTMLNCRSSIGILTECADMLSEPYFDQCGWSSADTNIHVTGQAKNSHLSQLIIGDNPTGSLDEIADAIREMTERHMRNHPDTGALVLECTNFAPFTHLIQEIAGVPVFGINQLLEYIDSCVNAPVYRNEMY